jgi:hypothetical protein
MKKKIAAVGMALMLTCALVGASWAHAHSGRLAVQDEHTSYSGEMIGLDQVQAEAKPRLKGVAKLVWVIVGMVADEVAEVAAEALEGRLARSPELAAIGPDGADVIFDR